MSASRAPPGSSSRRWPLAAGALAVLAAGGISLGLLRRKTAEPRAEAAAEAGRIARAEPAPAAGSPPVPAPAGPSPAAGSPPVPAPAEPARAAGSPPVPAPGPAAPGPAEKRRSDEAAYRRALASAARKYQSSNFAGAIADYRRALALKETSPALAGLGRALYDANQPAPALDALLRAVELDPRNAEAYLALGEVYVSMDRKREARAAYLRYLELAPQGQYARDVRSVLSQLR